MEHIYQSEIFATELKRLNNDVTASDRKAICKERNLTRATISSYLNGKVRDNDTAATLIAFFKERIQERNKVLLSV